MLYGFMVPKNLSELYEQMFIYRIFIYTLKKCIYAVGISQNIIARLASRHEYKCVYIILL